MKSFGKEIRKLAGEKFKKIPGSDNGYLISNYGRIVSPPQSTYPSYRILSLKKEINGYPTVGVMVEGRRKFRGVHRWVLLAFKGECPRGLIGIHKDDNRRNNKLKNLKYGTYTENNISRFKNDPTLGFRCTAKIHGRVYVD